MLHADARSGRRGLLTLEQLRVEVGEGTIDTVVLAFTDMQGRLQGKRLSAEFFLDEVVPHHAEGCNYLLAVDVEMNTVDGYEMSSWERGYGDFVLVPALEVLALPQPQVCRYHVRDVQADDRDRNDRAVGRGVPQVRQAEDERAAGRQPDRVGRRACPLVHPVPDARAGQRAVPGERVDHP